VLDAEAMVDLDTTGAEALRETLTLLAIHEVTFALSRAHQPLIDWLVKYHLLELIGETQLYPTKSHAVAAFRQEQGQVAAETAATPEEVTHD
jgi:hypothetical protein